VMINNAETGGQMPLIIYHELEDARGVESDVDRFIATYQIEPERFRDQVQLPFPYLTLPYPILPCLALPSNRAGAVSRPGAHAPYSRHLDPEPYTLHPTPHTRHLTP